MPNEPDNKMDDLLKAYAQKRKADAGESLELHPATRRLLQAEAAKLRPKAEPKASSWFSLVLARWPGIALAVGLFLLLGVGVRLILPVNEHSEPQMFAKQDATVDRLESGEVRSKKEANSGPKDAVPLAPKLARDESTVAQSGKSLERALSDAGKPGTADADNSLSAVPPAASPPQRARFSQNEAAPPASPARPVNLPERRELEVARTASPAPTAAPQLARRAQRAAGVAGESIELPSLGTFTNSSPRPEVALQLASQAIGGTRGVERKQVESRLGTLQELQAPVSAPAPELSATLQKAKQTESLRSDNDAGGVVPSQIATVQTAQAPQALPGGVAKNDERQARVSGFQEGAGEARTTTSAAPQAVGQERSYRFAATSGSMGLSRAVVLTSFNLQQGGDQVRVLDSDGSIYDGTVVETDGAAADFFAAARDGLQTQSDALVKSAELKRQGSGAGGGRAIQFRVAGTNRTLNLPVILEGSFIAATSNVAVDAVNRVGQRPSAGTSPADAAVAPTVDRVVGRARIGPTNEVLIDASRTRN